MILKTGRNTPLAMKKLNYKNIEDFILDESFREFVANTNTVSVSFWVNWSKEHPTETEVFENAIEVLKVLLNTRKQTVLPDKKEEWALLLKNMELVQKSDKKPINAFFQSRWMRIAAIMVLSIGLSVFWNWVSSKKDITESSFCEIIVPIGEKSQLILPDGTHVWINSGSHFKYPVLFGEKTREVYLQGEAYFDVTKQKGKNFVVNTTDVKIKVLGTAFNVKCYPGDNKTSTTVVRGLVQVENLFGKKEIANIKPHEIAIVHKKYANSTMDQKSNEKMTSISVSHINPEVVTCWKDQLLVFSDEPLEDMAIKMERWFNIAIVIPDEKLRTERYNAKFTHNETIYQVLEAIKLTTPITYKVENNMIIITHK